MIVFTEEKKFSREDVQELFLSVGWISGQYPGRLFKALMNSSTVVTAWDGDRLAGLVRYWTTARWLPTCIMFWCIPPIRAGGLLEKWWKWLRKIQGLPVS